MEKLLLDGFAGAFIRPQHSHLGSSGIPVGVP
jgi:hypothetical protein